MNDTFHRRTPATATARATALALALLAAAAAARADDDDRRRRAPAPVLTAYTQECGACHVPYPAGLLPAASWQRLMANLPHHFGTDASLAPEARDGIAGWLQRYAGTSRRLRDEFGAPPEDRITRAAWFERKHRKVDARTWTRPAVKSAAQCDACHPGAAQGDFDDHGVRIPR